MQPAYVEAGFLPSQFFTLAEFACKDGTAYPVAWAHRWNVLVPKTCDPIRRMWGGPNFVVSGYRTEAYNESLATEGHNVASMSQHVQGNAADLKPEISTGDPVFALHEMVLRAYEVGQLPFLGGLGLYPGWIHVDTYKAADGHLRRWNERK